MSQYAQFINGGRAEKELVLRHGNEAFWDERYKEQVKITRVLKFSSVEWGIRSFSFYA